jgi:hypothetical protein
MVDRELKSELRNYKKFETLNNERITPYFMSLVKNAEKSDTPTIIRDDEGRDFNNLNELKEYVGSYFKNIYKKDNGTQDTVGTDQINNFLGEHITSKEEIRNAKLTAAEREELDQPLSLLELERSMNSANMKSAPGSNGISNKFIRKYWDLLKFALLKYANYAFVEGKLTDSFRTADIKIIPKKGGDLTKIKNWRPISLLNCFYKCISRVFAERLKKYMNKLTPCAQKGYANGRYCQEVLISVVETIEKCNHFRKKGAILCLDVKKAFDSLSHSYMKNIFEFYNFGPNISRWLSILSMNRAARIVIEKDLYTDVFELERGNAQGDTISPFLFNLGYQILLFKLEYDLQIAGLIEEVAIPDFLLPLPTGISQVPPRVYALADDATVLTSLDERNLRKIREILIKFRVISGLETNVEKTTLMQIGSEDPIPQGILDLGFDVQNSVKLLGLKIKNRGETFSENFESMEEKIQNQIRFWTRFNLSLPGRINVAKTFMYSNLNYLGCFLPMPGGKITQISNLIENYVKGTLNIAKERLTKKREEGGLGLFDIEIFLRAQACTWAKRAQNLDDNWKLRLYSKSLGSTLCIKSAMYDARFEPVLFYIAESMERFTENFCKKNENIREAFIIQNTEVKFGGENEQYFDFRFFGNLDAMQKRSLCKIAVKDLIYANNTPALKEDFTNKTGVPIAEDRYTILRRACLESVTRNEKELPEEKKSTDLTTFCNRFRKGSKSFRRIISGPLAEIIPRNIETYAANTETFIGLEKARKINALWGYGYLSNELKIFLFKMHNNILGLNHRVAHFADVAPTCTFCTLAQLNDAENEDTLHLFYSCRYTERLLGGFFEWAYNIEERYIISRSDLFTVYECQHESESRIKTLIAKIFLKYIWECKLRFTFPVLEDAKTYATEQIICMYDTSKIFRKDLADSGLANLFLQG